MADSLTKAQRRRKAKKEAQKNKKAEKEAEEARPTLTGKEDVPDNTIDEQGKLDSEKTEEDNFESELCWCIEQLELGLKNRKPTKDEAQKSLKLIKTLRSEKTAKLSICHTIVMTMDRAIAIGKIFFKISSAGVTDLMVLYYVNIPELLTAPEISRLEKKTGLPRWKNYWDRRDRRGLPTGEEFDIGNGRQSIAAFCRWRRESFQKRTRIIPNETQFGQPPLCLKMELLIAPENSHNTRSYG
eukprot:gene15222-16795_t